MELRGGEITVPECTLIPIFTMSWLQCFTTILLCISTKAKN